MFVKVYDYIKNYIKYNYKFLIFLFLLIFLFYYEFPYIIYKSGGTIDLTDRIEIENKYKENGDISMSYVTAIKGTAPFILLSYVLPDWDLYPLEEITTEDDYDEVLKLGKEDLNEGIDNAIIAAFNASGKGIKITKEFNVVSYLSDKAKTNIEVGDEILSINGVKATNLEEVKEYVNTLKEDDEVKVKVRKNGEKKDKKATIYKDEDNTLKIGIAFKTRYEYETSIPVSVKMKNHESGSSGGLMMSLAIYNALTEKDITNGLNIVGTGTINSEGIVGEIGGVKYKVLAAERIKADIFICPEGNYDEAMKIKKKRDLDIKIIKVNTLKEAIEKLNDLN